MSHTPDLIGKRFGYLTVVEKTDKRQGKNVYWLCKCDCGNMTYVTTSNLNQKQVFSCGCYRKKKSAESHFKHGCTNTKLFRVWCSMIARCYHSYDNSYVNYGARGICVCMEWKNSFSVFRDWAYSNGYQEGLTIDRIDNDGNYEPSNCRWVSRKVQGNNSRINHTLTFNGETKTISQWSEKLGIPYQRLLMRVHRGWSIEKCLNQ